MESSFLYSQEEGSTFLGRIYLSLPEATEEGNEETTVAKDKKLSQDDDG